MDGFVKELIERIPLADVAMELWSWITDSDRLEEIWKKHRGRCFENLISFPVMVNLVADALLKYESGRESFEKNREDGVLEASIQAAYKKLGRCPIAVSQAFLQSASRALRKVFPSWAEWKKPQSLVDFRIVIYDGKAIKKVAKRLKPLRGISGGLLGGRALVAIEWETGLAIAMWADPDGEANDVKFVKSLVPEVCRELPGPRLHVSDRAFCDLEQPRYFTAAEGDCFLVRHHTKVKFHRDPQVPSRRGKTAEGDDFLENGGWLGSESDHRRRRVRQIELLRPGRETITLITDLFDEDLYPAEDLLWIYRERWEIERLFQKVTEVFGLSHLIGGTPKATIFQFAFCMVLYNMIQVIRGSVAETQDREPSEISTEMLFRDVARELITCNTLLTTSQTEKYYAHKTTSSQLRKHLNRRLQHAWSDTWIASPPQATHRITPKRRSPTHNSVHRIIFGPPPKKKRINLASQRCLQQ